MTAQEIDSIQNAIRHIQTAVDIDPWAVEIAVEAMGKQIPKKPIWKNKNDEFDGNWIKICPTCGRVLVERITTPEKSRPIIYNISNVCLCGQQICWEDE